MMKQYTVEATNDEITSFVTQLDDLSKLFLKKGFLDDKDLRPVLFCARLGDWSSKPRSDRVLNQRRCVLLNHSAVVEDESKKKVAAKEAKGGKRKRQPQGVAAPAEEISVSSVQSTKAATKRQRSVPAKLSPYVLKATRS